MKFRSKVFLAIAPLAAALILLALLAVRTTDALRANTHAILHENYRSVLAAQRMAAALYDMDRAVLFYAVGRGAWDAARMDGAQARFESELAVELDNVTEPGEAEAAAALQARWRDYRARLDALRALPPAAALEQYFTSLEPAFTAVRAAVDRILELNQDAMVRKSERAAVEAEQMGATILGASLLALLAGIALSVMLTDRLLQPLDALRMAAHRIGAGDFGARVGVAGRNELAQLAETFNSMADRLDRYRRSSLGELLLAQQSAQSAIDSLPDAVVVFNAAGDVLIVNSAGEALLGAGAAASAAPLARLEPDLRQVIERARGHVLGGKGAYLPSGFDEAVRLRSGAGDDRYLLPRATPVYDERGTITGATVLLQDITRLRRVDELKNDLVATVAHEFRTPLTSLRMALHLCLEQAAGPLSERQADLLYAARDDCERLQRIVDELLDLARIQGGAVALRRRGVAVRSLLVDALQAQRTAAEAHSVELSAAIDPDLPQVDIDEERLLVVFANLVGNAIRHSPQGGEVKLCARAEDGRIRFSVIDQGPGIPADERKHIFEKFAQGRMEPGAAGLGLSIAREIVVAHGGTIGVDSELGRGSTFWFTIPLAHEDARAAVG
ncbi:MAG: ATP-binding protein [Candidatus Binatia bacterium]